MNWNLKSFTGELIESGVESKKLNPNEMYRMPVNFSSENVILEVIAQYGAFQSKASRAFTVLGDTSSYITIAMYVILASIVMLIIYVFMIATKRR